MPDIETPNDTPLVTELETPQVPTTAVESAAIEKAREQEKAKLYARMKKEEEARQKAEDRATQIEAQLKELTAFKEQAENEKLTEKERLEKQILQLQTKLTDAENTLTKREEALNAKIHLYELSQYRTRRIKEVELDSDFEDFVYGGSEDEIDASLKVAQEKEAKFKQKYAAPTTRPQAPPAANPGNMLQTPGQQYTYEDLKNAKDLKELEKIKQVLLRERGLR